MSVPRFWREIPARYNLIGTRCETCDTYYLPAAAVLPDLPQAG